MTLAWTTVGFWSQFWALLKRVPAGIWLALGAASALLVLYLRGRRLETELAQAKLQQVVSQAHAGIARDEGRAGVHLARVRDAERRIEEIETARALASSSGAQDEKRLNTLSPDRVHVEYMKLLVRKRAELNIESTLKTGASLGKITLREKRALGDSNFVPWDDVHEKDDEEP